MASRSRRVKLDGNALAYWRERRMLTQEQLARKVKMSNSTISRLENQRHDARFSTISKLAKVLRVAPEDLRVSPEDLIDTDPPRSNHKAA